MWTDVAPAPTALHVCTRYRRGGSERRLRDCIRAVPELRHHVLLGEDSDLELARAQTGAEHVESLPSLVRPVSPARDLAAVYALWRLIRSRRYAVVVSHQSKAGVLTRLAASAGSGVPAVHSLSMASFGPGYGRLENWLFPRLERGLGPRTSAFCVVGSDLAHRFASVGVPVDRLHVVRSGVPLPTQLRGRAEARQLLDLRHGTRPGRRLICYVGSLEPRKNPLLLAALLRRLHDRCPDAPDLLVLGDGPERARLTAELAALGLADHAVLAGHVAEPEHVQDAFRGADLVVLLSDAEGLPQVLVQAAAAGTPFVAFDVEGVREVLALGAQGSAVPLGRVDDAADAAQQWLASPPTACREPLADLSTWSPEAIADAYRAVFDRVVGTLPVRLPERAPLTVAS
ncbi:glycosyltransferase [Geodermatophilus sp. SYSU D00691]